MKVETKVQANACVVELTFTAEAAETTSEVKRVFREIVNAAQIPGFRKGKVPPEVVRAKFANEIKGETQIALWRKFYPEAIKEAKLEPLNIDGEPVMELKDGTYTCTVKVEVAPEFKLPKYKGLSLKKGDVTVKDEQVTENLEAFRKQCASYEDAKPDQTAAEGDFVQVDYSGTLDGEPLSAVVPDQKAICGATGQWLMINEGSFVPELLNAMKGMKIGDEKTDVAVKFPKDAAPEPIKGKKVLYKIALKNLRKCVLPDDAELAKKAKKESFEAMRAEMRTMLEKQAVADELDSRKNQAIDLLLKKSDFDVPPYFVAQQVQQSIQQLAQRAQYQGITAEYIEKNREKILSDAQTQAENRVRLAYILHGIAKAENLTVDEKDEEKAEAALSDKALDFILAEAKK